MRKISGGYSDGETPVPIPNTAVKPISADGTWGEAPWESRTPPGFLRQGPLRGPLSRSRQGVARAPSRLGEWNPLLGIDRRRGRRKRHLVAIVGARRPGHLGGRRFHVMLYVVVPRLLLDLMGRPYEGDARKRELERPRVSTESG
jgi:hypothetical protein